MMQALGSATGVGRAFPAQCSTSQSASKRPARPVQGLRSSEQHLVASSLAQRSRRCKPLAAVQQEEASVSATDIHPDIESMLFTEEVIQAAVLEMGRQLAVDYKDKRPLLLTTLAGAFMFTADLCRAMAPVPDGLQLDFLRASSYGAGTVSSGNVELQLNLQIPIEGRHVLLIEDLVDSGRTLHALLGRLREARPASIKVVTLLRKNVVRAVDIEPDYCCLEFDGGFIVGYGIDYAENYRSLPYIGILSPRVYETAAEP